MFGDKAETYLNLVDENQTRFFLGRESRNIPKFGRENRSIPKFGRENKTFQYLVEKVGL